MELHKIESDIELVTFYDLSDTEQSELNDYDGYQDSSFFRFNGRVNDLNDFMRLEGNFNAAFEGYNAYHNDTYFSGTIIRLSDCGDSVTAAYYYC